MNIFKTAPKFLILVNELRRFNSNGQALDAARKDEDWEKERDIIIDASWTFADNCARKGNINIELYGEENIPDDGPVLIVGNHQGYADILALYYVIRKFQIGFVAKQEFSNVPIFKHSLNYTRSIFIERDNPREAIKALKQGTEMLKQGFSLVIFPEGTRSKSRKMGEFKPGSFKFAQRAGVPVLPVTIDGGYHLFEEDGTYHPCSIRVTVHPLVHFEDMNKHEQVAAEKDIEATIRKCLEENDPV